MARKDPSFSKRLQEILIQRDMSPSDLAKKIGRPYPTVHVYLKEGRIPEAPILMEISKALGVSMEELLGGKSETAEKKGRKTYSVSSGIDLSISAVAEGDPLAKDIKKAVVYLKAMDEETRGVALRILADMTRLRGEN